MPGVAVVTDSTASLPAEVAARAGVRVVPLQVVIGNTSYDEGPEATPELLADALRRWEPVSTSRPNPEQLCAVYAEVATRADAIVSVHLSGELSGTVDSARVAARSSRVPVEVVDSRQVGMGTGFAVLAAAEAATAGASVTEVAEAATRTAEATSSLFYVDTLEHLRRGGRVGAAAAMVGSALAVKPILEIVDGRIVPRERIRTSGRALARLGDLAVELAGDGPVGVAVAHLASPDRAGHLAQRLSDALGDRLTGAVELGEIGAVLGAHVGPGMVSVTIVRRS